MSTRGADRWLVGLTLTVIALALVAAAVVVLPHTPLDALVAGVGRRVGAAMRQAGSQTGPPPGRVTVRVDARQSPRAISPLIYGLAVADAERLQATRARLNRWGGNPNTRYNWQHGSAWNAARDWEFRNYGGPATAPSATADTFAAINRSFGVLSVVTVPAIGWVARNGDTETRSVNVPIVGGPPLPDNPQAIQGYDPAANRAATSVHSVARGNGSETGVVAQDAWVLHLAQHGVHTFVVDNEPDLWPITHTDVHPVEPSYDDMVNVFEEYATAIKDADPEAQVLGPALSGWLSLMYSARDRGQDNFRSHADRRAHADMPFLPWWLEQIRRRDEQAGRRSLDVLDVHFYPQAQDVFSNASDSATNALRLRSTRALWDADYVDESWIGEPVRLIPRLRESIDRYYPGTRLGINEWNWGADQTMNGALAIADVLGIFGREGVDMAAYWTVPPAGSPGEHAFALYTNYDDQGHAFGDQALAASSDAPDDVTVYASRDSPSGDVLLMALNKRAEADIPLVVQLDGTKQGETSAYRYSARQPDAIERLGSVQLGELALPAESITLLRITAPGP